MAEQDRHKGALDKAREEFVFLSVKEMLAEFSETLSVEPAERSPAASAGRVICLPASDEADEITAAMLAQLMEQAGYATLAFPLDSSLHHSIGLRSRMRKMYSSSRPYPRLLLPEPEP